MSLHLTFFPRVGPLPVNKRKGLANYHRQSRTAVEPSWEEFPSLSRAGTVRGFMPRPFIYTISPSGLPEVEVEKGCRYVLGHPHTGRTSGWEELLQLPVFYWRQKLSDPGVPLLLPRSPEHQVRRPWSLW